MCFSFCLSYSSSYAISPVTYQVVLDCYVFEEPSFESENVMFESEEVMLSHGQEVLVIQEGERFSFVHVQDEIYGYVYNFYLSPIGGQEVYPTFNGFVRTDGAIIYDLNYLESGYVASAGQQIFLYEGYNSSEFTAVQIVLEDGSLYNGYMLTADIEPQGISSSLIVGITIIVAIVTIILSLLFIKKKKKKKSGSES